MLRLPEPEAHADRVSAGDAWFPRKPVLQWGKGCGGAGAERSRGSAGAPESSVARCRDGSSGARCDISPRTSATVSLAQRSASRARRSAFAMASYTDAGVLLAPSFAGRPPSEPSESGRAAARGAAPLARGGDAGSDSRDRAPPREGDQYVPKLAPENGPRGGDSSSASIAGRRTSRECSSANGAIAQM